MKKAAEDLAARAAAQIPAAKPKPELSGAAGDMTGEDEAGTA